MIFDWQLCVMRPDAVLDWCNHEDIVYLDFPEICKIKAHVQSLTDVMPGSSTTVHFIASFPCGPKKFINELEDSINSWKWKTRDNISDLENLFFRKDGQWDLHH